MRIPIRILKNYVKEFENNQADAGVNKDAQLIVSNVKYPRNDDEAKTSVYTQTKNIYDLLTATIDDKNKGGIIYDEEKLLMVGIHF